MLPLDPITRIATFESHNACHCPCVCAIISIVCVIAKSCPILADAMRLRLILCVGVWYGGGGVVSGDGGGLYCVG